MIDAFQRGEDIHQATAAKVFSIPYDSVNKSQREQAKTVNFGITYGQSAFALGDQLGISRTDAQSLIDSYFDQFSAIRSFMDDTVKMARNSGYVETMMGRQRMIDDIDSSNRSLQGNAQRIAINTRVQGSAADIIKKAMLMVDAFMVGFSSKMILQVHDELIFDVKQEEAAKITPELLNIMRSAVDLSVPLTVDIEKGKNWGF